MKMQYNMPGIVIRSDVHVHPAGKIFQRMHLSPCFLPLSFCFTSPQGVFYGRRSVRMVYCMPYTLLGLSQPKILIKVLLFLTTIVLFLILAP